MCLGFWRALWSPKSPNTQQLASGMSSARLSTQNSCLLSGVSFAPGPEQQQRSRAHPRRPRGWAAPAANVSELRLRTRLRFYLNHFPSPLRFACYFLLASRAGGGAHRRLPWPHEHPGLGKRGWGCSPSPRPLSAPQVLAQHLPSDTSGVCTMPKAQHRPQGEPEEPSKPRWFAPTTCLERRCMTLALLTCLSPSPLQTHLHPSFPSPSSHSSSSSPTQSPPPHFPHRPS